MKRKLKDDLKEYTGKLKSSKNADFGTARAIVCGRRI